MTDINKADQSASPKKTQVHDTNAEAQQARMLARLQTRPIDTITARSELNVMAPTVEPIGTMPPEHPGTAGLAVESYRITLGLGIAASGNLLPYTASNGETGRCSETVTDLGWLLLGELPAKLSHTGKAIRNRRPA